MQENDANGIVADGVDAIWDFAYDCSKWQMHLTPEAAQGVRRRANPSGRDIGQGRSSRGRMWLILIFFIFRAIDLIVYFGISTGSRRTIGIILCQCDLEHDPAGGNLAAIELGAHCAHRVSNIRYRDDRDRADQCPDYPAKLRCHEDAIDRHCAERGDQVDLNRLG